MNRFEISGSSVAVKRVSIAALALGVAISFGGLPAMAQNESSAPPPSAQQPPQDVPPPQPPLQSDPRYGDPQQGYPQGAPPQQGAPYPQGGYQGGYRGQYQGPYQGGPQAGNPAPQLQVPDSLTLPAGVVIQVRVSQWISSDRNHSGDNFSATLDQPLLANGWVIARRGQPIVGHVAVAEKAGHGKSDSRLGLAVDAITLANGQQVPIGAELVRMAAGGPSDGQRVGAVAATTIIGAAIGAVAGGGTGAAIGAGVGAGAGVAGVVATRGRPTVVGPETLLSFRLEQPLEISTEGNAAAFQPFSQYPQDQQDQDAYAGRRYPAGGRPYPGPYPGPYPYPAYYGPCYGCYPYPYAYGPVVGFGFGFGPRRGFRRW